MDAPEGCILNATYPRAVASRHSVGQLLPDVVFGCLSQVCRVQIKPCMLRAFLLLFHAENAVQTHIPMRHDSMHIARWIVPLISSAIIHRCPTSSCEILYPQRVPPCSGRSTPEALSSQTAVRAPTAFAPLQF